MRRSSLVYPDKQGGTIPSIGYAQMQVHIIGQQRPTMQGMAAGYGPVITASDRLAPGFAPGEHDRSRGGGLLTQVDDIRSWQRWRLQSRTLQGGIPFGAGGSQEFIKRRRQGIVHNTQGGLAVLLHALQIQIHRVDHQQGIFGLPGSGIDAQQQILEGR